MKFFEDLASDLHTAWIALRLDELAFPDLAQSLLERFSPASAINPDEIFRWLMAAGRLPKQFDPHSRFGNFALTVATRDDFHIDVLVWTDSTTAIHQHSFSGAFHVLHGASLHTSWSFDESTRWSDRLKRGRLTVRASECLRKGTTRPILPGAQTIHSLFHLDSPSVTVVVRTPSAPVVSPQLCYERSGLAHDTFAMTERVEKIRQLLCLLWAGDHPGRVELSEAALSGVDAHAMTEIILSMRADTPAGTQERLIDLLPAREAELAALLRETVACRERDRVLVDLRRQTTDPRHRLLLALALNLPDRPAIDSVLREIAPTEPPATWLWETIRSMHETPSRRPDRPSVLGFSLNEVSEEALHLLLQGRPVEEVSRTVAQHDELVDDVRALCSTLSEVAVLAPLLEQPVSAG